MTAASTCVAFSGCERSAGVATIVTAFNRAAESTEPILSRAAESAEAALSRAAESGETESRRGAAVVS
jgi:hypothetical protein